MTRLHLDGLDHQSRDRSIIRQDLKTPGRIYTEFRVPIMSLTVKQARALADALHDHADKLEGEA